MAGCQGKPKAAAEAIFYVEELVERAKLTQQEKSSGSWKRYRHILVRYYNSQNNKNSQQVKKRNAHLVSLLNQIMDDSIGNDTAANLLQMHAHDHVHTATHGSTFAKTVLRREQKFHFPFFYQTPLLKNDK